MSLPAGLINVQRARAETQTAYKANNTTFITNVATAISDAVAAGTFNIIFNASPNSQPSATEKASFLTSMGYTATANLNIATWRVLISWDS